METTKNKFVTALPMVILTFLLIFQFLQLAFGGGWKQELCASAGKIYIQTKTAYSEVLRAMRAYSLPPAWGDGEQKEPPTPEPVVKMASRTDHHGARN